MHVFPIKSLRGFSPARWPVERRGLKHDRRWMLVDSDGVFLTQRRLAKMALFDVEPVPSGLRISLKGQTPLEVPFQPDGLLEMVRVWRSRVGAHPVSKDADSWFSQALGLPCRLVYMPESSRRTAKSPNALKTDIVGFADSNPILIAGQASLDDLNSRLSIPLPMIRFRANVVVAGSEAFEEDVWPCVSVGDVELRRTKKCGRCLVTTIDPQTAKTSDEPLRTLATFRREGKNVFFGSYFVPDRLGQIMVGDEVKCEGVKV